jgi:hypothetical protein
MFGKLRKAENKNGKVCVQPTHSSIFSASGDFESVKVRCLLNWESMADKNDKPTCLSFGGP